jgi:hypothetical protein
VNRKTQHGFQDGSGRDEIPPWVRDNLVLKLLDDMGLRVEIVYDRKYLNGLSNKPLVVVKGKGKTPLSKTL